MILICVGALISALISIWFGALGAFAVAVVSAIAIVVRSILDVRELRSFKLGGIPTCRVISEGWRR